MWKTKRIDMSALKATDEEFRYKGFGGRGIVAKTLTEEVDPKCDPLGPDNKLILACMATAGSGMSSCSRLSVGAKSPLTLGIKEANSGGMLGHYMARLGYMSMIVEGQAKDGRMYVLVLDKEGNVRFDDASCYRFMKTYDTAANLIENYGKDIGFAVIGPAGERGYPIASVQVNEFENNYPCRAAARGGLGAVMGSRGLKAIVIQKAQTPYKPDFVNPNLVAEKRLELNRMAADAIKAGFPLHTIGTPEGVKPSVESGKCPLKNFSGEIYPGVENLYVDQYTAILEERGSAGNACLPGCVVACSGIISDKEGNHITGGIEYETMALCGPNCGMTRLDDVIRMDRICDDIGIDTVEGGAICGIAMEGGLLKWGDGPGAHDLLEQIGEGTELGAICGKGTESIAAHLGVKRVPQTRHQAMPGYDPRATVPTGLAFIMGNMGADHTQAPSEGNFYGKPPEEVMGVYKGTEAMFSVVDNLGCMMNFIFFGERLPDVAQLYAGIYGGEGTPEQLFALGGEILALEEAFNIAAGWKKEDSVLPDFFYEETLPQTGQPFTIPKDVVAELVRNESKKL